MRGLALALLLLPLAARASEAPFTDVTTGGLHASTMRIRGGDRDANAEAFGISTTHVGFGFEKPVTVRVVNTGQIGVGCKGFEGGIGNELSGGLAWHGLFMRAGAEGGFWGNRYLWDSKLEIPEMHVGFQRLRLGSIAEIGAKVGYILWGRHNTGDGDSLSTSGAFELGTIASLHLGGIDVRATVDRILVRGASRPVNALESNVCGKTAWLQLCSDFRYELSDTRKRGVFEDVKTSYVGIMLGLPERPKKK